MMSDSSKGTNGSDLLAKAMRRVFEEEIGKPPDTTNPRVQPTGKDRPPQERGAA